MIQEAEPATRTPGAYMLLWANHERNGLSWADIVAMIKNDALASHLSSHHMTEPGHE